MEPLFGVTPEQVFRLNFGAGVGVSSHSGTSVLTHSGADVWSHSGAGVGVWSHSAISDLGSLRSWSRCLESLLELE